jgi:DNA-binding NarL/FixJ family response regulator
MSLDEARAYALSDSDVPTAIGPRLSRRESQVAQLVRQGMSNRRIAERLFISERTAEYHVASLMNKLGVNTRAEIAAWTVENLPAEQER